MAKNWEVIVTVCERSGFERIYEGTDSLPADALDCPRCGMPLDIYVMTMGEYLEIQARRRAWAEANERAMEDCDGSWDY